MPRDESKPEELTPDERRTLADFFAAALAQLKSSTEPFTVELAPNARLAFRYRGANAQG